MSVRGMIKIKGPFCQSRRSAPKGCLWQSGKSEVFSVPQVLEGQPTTNNQQSSNQLPPQLLQGQQSNIKRIERAFIVLEPFLEFRQGEGEYFEEFVGVATRGL